MTPLSPDLRRDLQGAVAQAREVAVEGARRALDVLGAVDDRPPTGLAPADRALRIALRAQARSLGGGETALGWEQLTEEIAYAAWHRMLFARFLAENGLLIEPATGAPVSVADVTDMAQEVGQPDRWVLAARYAEAMLPGIFGTSDPTTRVVFAPEDRIRLEDVLANLPAELFTADDALGWVYQYWQAKRKKEVNASGHKIGGPDVPPATQLFTEHYMVRFLLENSLGAWWATRHPGSPLVREWNYLRRREDGTPMAGSFEHWPARAAEITVMDPCMGSGHFLVAAADMLRKMRMEEERVPIEVAAESVICDNIFGLELDPRCTQLGAFALAFDAWKAGGRFRPLPVPNIACTGIAITGQLEDWRRLAGNDANLRAGLDRLHELFKDAPDLGSLIDPRSAVGDGLWGVDPDRLLTTLSTALARETEDPAAAVFGAAAEGTARAARLMSRRYCLVATNPPYLSRGKQAPTLKSFCDKHLRDARTNLCSSFVQLFSSPSRAQTAAFVISDSVLTLTAYTQLRRRLLTDCTWNFVARLGTQAFSTALYDAPIALLCISPARPDASHMLPSIDGATRSSPEDVASALRFDSVIEMGQREQLENPDSRIVGRQRSSQTLLATFARGFQGIKTGDDGRYRRHFWEVANDEAGWVRLLGGPSLTSPYTARTDVVLWQSGRGSMASGSASRIVGRQAWGRLGVLVSQMGAFPATIYTGEKFDTNASPLVPNDQSDLSAIWCFVTSPDYRVSLRAIESATKVTNATLTKVPFDHRHWQQVALERYPHGLPEPCSDDPTQWLFRGDIPASVSPLHVAVARLLGYRWPDQPPDSLDGFADPDGIVCLPSVSGDPPAADRLEKLLAAAYGDQWSPTMRAQVIANTGGKAATLDAWLRDEFFRQHVRLFDSRPFIWHVWDGRRDGFSALLHYHRLDRSTLEKLTYSHVGDWLERARADRDRGEPGADGRVAAAAALQDRLRFILEGEAPNDIYVRWKSAAEQPLGWEPDLNDGVRLNIRPFVLAGILRDTFTIHWNKDRGLDPGNQERKNDKHLTGDDKRRARELQS